MGITLIFKNKERREYGSNEPSRYVPPEKGRSSIFVMSEGALEKEEINDIVEAAQEKEDTRIKKGYKRSTQRRLEQVVQKVLQAPAGERAKTFREVTKQKEHHI